MPILLKLLSSPRAWIAIALSILLAFTHLSAYRHGRQSVQSAWDRDKVAQQAAVNAAAARNIELQRAAEKNYVVTRDAQDRYFTTTVREIVHDAAPLAACLVPDSVRLRLNAAAGCARGDSPASCGPAGEVPGAR